MNGQTPTMHWDDDDLIAAGREPGHWDRHGNPAPQLHTPDDIEAAEREGAYFWDMVALAKQRGTLKADDDHWDTEVRRRAGLLDHDPSPEAQTLRRHHGIPETTRNPTPPPRQDGATSDRHSGATSNRHSGATSS